MRPPKRQLRCRTTIPLARLAVEVTGVDISPACINEARRQIAILEDGGEIVQETRLYDPDKGETRSMRSKEEAHDYRYFPDPDLLPLELEQAWVDDLAKHLPGGCDVGWVQFGGSRKRLHA